MHIREAAARCIAACEAEAVSMGFIPEAGRDIYLGSVADDLGGWTEQQYLNWIKEIEGKYGEERSSDLLALYESVGQIMADYVPVLKASTGRFDDPDLES